MNFYKVTNISSLMSQRIGEAGMDYISVEAVIDQPQNSFSGVSMRSPERLIIRGNGTALSVVETEGIYDLHDLACGRPFPKEEQQKTITLREVKELSLVAVHRNRCRQGV